MIDKTLMDYFKTNSLLQADHKYSLTEIEQMIPFERDLYIDLIINRQQQRDQPNNINDPIEE